MKKQKAKYFYMAAFVLILVAFFLLYPKPSTTLIPDTITPSNGGILIPASYTDANVMPDKYSTGVPAGTTLTPISSAGTYNNVTYKISGGNKLGLDLFYNNTTVGDSIVISNVDFSAMPFIFLNEEQVTTPKTVTFVNCKFDSVTTGRQDCLITHYFERCTIRNFSGSNSILNNCIFGGSTTDGINPYRNVTITNSYICDLARSSSEIVHTDGVQIFGYAGLDAQNISFSNCRFEAPSFSYQGSASYVNACLMVALEKSNGNNISFRNCYVNGGGYTIYSTVTSGYKLSNIVFDDISVGCTARFGMLVLFGKQPTIIFM